MLFDPINPERMEETRKWLTEEFNKPVSHEEVSKSMPGVPFRRSAVIELTKLNDSKFTLNCELIETMESTPDTVIMLVTGRRYIVKETVDDVRKQTIAYKQSLNRLLQTDTLPERGE